MSKRQRIGAAWILAMLAAVAGCAGGPADSPGEQDAGSGSAEKTPHEHRARAVGPPVTAVAAQAGFTCAVLGCGLVKCWGNGAWGQLGSGATDSRGDGPREMGDSLSVLDLGAGEPSLTVSGGAHHTCALSKGRVKCWGRNDSGQLGLGDVEARGDSPRDMGDNLPPVDLGAGKMAVAVEVGGTETCALLQDGAVKCWGENDLGQLGQGDNRSRGASPDDMGDNLPAVDLGTDRAATAIAVGRDYACALLDGGSVKCWGGNYWGQLGQGDTMARGGGMGEMGERLSAVDLGDAGTAIALSAGDYHVCALLHDGAVKCWGAGFQGQLGQGDPWPRGAGPRDMGEHLPPVSLDEGKTAVAVSAGGLHTCAVLNDGAVKCWGGNEAGQLGLGDRKSRGDEPGEMGDALPAVSLGAGAKTALVSGGSLHTCALQSDGKVKCWGDNEAGQLGLGDRKSRGDEPGEMGDALPAVSLGEEGSLATSCP